jgi:hypothetical protein
MNIQQRTNELESICLICVLLFFSTSDFKIREIGINHFYTVQCVLRINLFNEVIFIIQWFWLISISAGSHLIPLNYCRLLINTFIDIYRLF